MEKIPCRECSTPILPDTAERTGGLCMACKQGIRQNIEKSKIYYKRRNHDPRIKFWIYLRSKFEKSEFLEFSKDEELYFAANLFMNEVLRGGFDAFFSNSSGDLYGVVVAALVELEEFESLKILRAAAATLFDKMEVPTDRAERWRVISSLSDAVTFRLNQLDTEFYNKYHQFGERLDEFARKHGLLNSLDA